MKTTRALAIVIGVIALMVTLSPFALAWHSNGMGGKDPDPGDTCPDPDRPGDMYVWSFTPDPNANNGNGPNGQSGHWGWEEVQPPPPTGGGSWGTAGQGPGTEDFNQHSYGGGQILNLAENAKIVPTADLQHALLAAAAMKDAQFKDLKVVKVSAVANQDLSSLVVKAIRDSGEKPSHRGVQTAEGFTLVKSITTVKKVTQSPLLSRGALPEPIPRPASKITAVGQPTGHLTATLCQSIPKAPVQANRPASGGGVGAHVAGRR